MDILKLTDLPTVACTVAAVLVPELIRGFGRREALFKLGLLTAFCLLAALSAHFFQVSDPAAAFTRAFLIAVTARLSLLINHVSEAMLARSHRLDERLKRLETLIRPESN